LSAPEAFDAVPYAIELVGVAKHYGQSTALADVNLAFEPGKFVVLLGPSGCGKSTILKIIAGLEDATEGDIYINGAFVNYVRPKERDVSMVFQNYALYPHMTVEANLAFPLKMRGVKAKDIAPQLKSVAELLGLHDQLHKYPDQLSGGQRQRVALGRAIIRHPIAFLMDEPLSNLDALLRVQMRAELMQLHRRVGRTTVYVTHDQVEAMTMADMVVVMNRGRVQQVGTPSEVYSRPANTFVATFVGSPQMNLFDGSLVADGSELRFQGDVAVVVGEGWRDAPAGEVTLGIRPEDVTIADRGTAGTIEGNVELVEDVGAELYVSVALPKGRCVVRTNLRRGLKEGEPVALRFTPEALHIFAKNGERLARTGERLVPA
jgi:ABC-type sugar transport system ATPase subunit